MSANFLVCPRCGSTKFYVTDPAGRMVFFQLDHNRQVIATTNDHPALEQLNLREIFCTGCSWSGAARQLMPQSL